MDRIVHSTAVDIGGGKRGFRSKDTVAGVPGTVVTATHLNATQEEMVTMIEKAGIAPDPADLAQLVKAIRSQRLNYVPVVAGTANALSITLDPAPTDWAQLIGVPLRIIPSATNTAGAVLAVTGLPGNKQVVRLGGAGLVAGDLPQSAVIELVYDSVAMQLVSMTQVGQVGYQEFTAPGATVWNVPAGVRRIRVRAWGGGGGGGGSFNAQSCASGGCGGGYVEGVYPVIPGSPLTVNVGAGGAAGTAGGGAGGDGGSSGIATVCTANGGKGGNGAAAGTVSVPQFAAASSPPGNTSGGTIYNLTGGGSGVGFQAGSTSLLAGGAGGFSYQSPPTQVSVNSAGVAGNYPGGGGGGATANANGGVGANGRVEISW